MRNERERVKVILHDAIHWGCRYEPCPNLNCEQCALDRIDALYEAEDNKRVDAQEVYADIVDKLNKAVILHSEIKPNGNVMIKGGAIFEILKEYTTKLRDLTLSGAIKDILK